MGVGVQLAFLVPLFSQPWTLSVGLPSSVAPLWDRPTDAPRDVLPKVRLMNWHLRPAHQIQGLCAGACYCQLLGCWGSVL